MEDCMVYLKGQYRFLLIVMIMKLKIFSKITLNKKNMNLKIIKVLIRKIKVWMNQKLLE
jgi:hypothetical protein